MNEIIIKDENLIDLDKAAVDLINFFEDYKIILLEGQMGSGKTTLIKSISKALGSTNHFSSPTYSIVNEYQYKGGKIYHFDLYRIGSMNELLDIGVEEYLRSNQFCFIEWPEMVKDIIDSKFIEIEIKLENNFRYIRASKFNL